MPIQLTLTWRYFLVLFLLSGEDNPTLSSATQGTHLLPHALELLGVYLCPQHNPPVKKIERKQSPSCAGPTMEKCPQQAKGQLAALWVRISSLWSLCARAPSESQFHRHTTFETAGEHPGSQVLAWIPAPPPTPGTIELQLQADCP